MYLSPSPHPSLHNNLIDSLKSFFENGRWKGRFLVKKKIRESEGGERERIERREGKRGGNSILASKI